MNGIDKITQRIGADTGGDRLADAAAQAESRPTVPHPAEAEDQPAGKERGPRRSGRDVWSCRPDGGPEEFLTAKQEMVEWAYQRALESSTPCRRNSRWAAGGAAGAGVLHRTGGGCSSRRIGRVPARRL
ncbi:MAG: hypothetical protein ACLTYN_04675 [Dysosmobacter welbionis]